MAFKVEPMFSVVPLEWLDTAWPVAKPFLERGLKAAQTSTLGGLLQNLYSGQEQLWLIHQGDFRGAFVTNIRDEDIRFLGISNLGGEGAKAWIVPLVKRLTHFSRANGCAAFRWYGRKAWTRLFPAECKIIGGKSGQLLFERAV